MARINYSVTATDKARNESEPATVTVDVDATPPPVKRFVTRSGTGIRPRERCRCARRRPSGVRR